jgi:hypothetical protein
MKNEINYQEKLRKNIRDKVALSKWKYPRECKNKFFDSNKNTDIKDYLSMIFHDTQDFIHDEVIPNEIYSHRGINQFRRFRPDMRSEDLGLIVEFDGVNHYSSLHVVLSDKDKDEYLRSAGYKIVRIPYFVVLSPTSIMRLFGVDVNDRLKDTGVLDYGLFDSPDNDYGLKICPQSFCHLGMMKFFNDVKAMTKHEKTVLDNDLNLVSLFNKYGIPSIPEIYQNEYNEIINN